MEVFLYIFIFMFSLISCILLLYEFKVSEKKVRIRKLLGLLFFIVIPIMLFMFNFIDPIIILITTSILAPTIGLIIAIKNIKTTKGLKLFSKVLGIIFSALALILGTGLFAMAFTGGTTVDKPIIYLYPTEETEISVTLGIPQNLTHTYPKYENSWNVLAKPNGDLIDLKTGRNLYSLYWEGLNTVKPNMSEGFVIEGKDTIAFLEEKLAILGLTEREANEFIIYWLPKLENNKYNFIRFQTLEEINNNMPLQITPTPDTIIRVVMEFKGLNKYVEISEQKLVTPIRNGFVVVEWGGTEIR